MRPLVARCHLSIGKLYQRPGTRQQAREHLATATTMYRKMDMHFWWDQAEAEMAALGYAGEDTASDRPGGGPDQAL